jgi:hypothetical protein
MIAIVIHGNTLDDRWTLVVMQVSVPQDAQDYSRKERCDALLAIERSV